MLHLIYFTITTAAANSNEAMEAETISKNGRNPKSHTSRGNFSKIDEICYGVIQAVI